MSFLKNTFSSVIALAIICGVLSSNVNAQDTPAAEPSADDNVASLLKDLDAKRFATRENASKKLEELGNDAIPAMTKAALESKSREVSVRIIDILKQNLQTGGGVARTNAKAALEKIAASDALANERAKEALKEKAPPAAPGIPRLGGIRGLPGRIQIQVGGAGGNLQRKRMQVVNGVKTIDVTSAIEATPIKITNKTALRFLFTRLSAE